MNLSRDAMEALPALVVGFLLATVVALLVTPLVSRGARWVGMVDHPEARRVNVRAVPRGGGVAVGIGFVVVSLVMLAWNAWAGRPFVDEAVITNTQLAALVGGAALAVALGLVDDFLQLRARWQMLCQVLLALFAVGMGIGVHSVNLPFAPNGTLDIPDFLVALVTVVWIVGMINSINFIDGLDGLSTGIGLVAAVTLGVISIGASTDEPFVALFCFILAGAMLGFLRWNFHPASIFPGTSGIMLAGYSLAVLSILGAAKIAVALLVLGVPIMDTFWIIVRRLAMRRSPFAPDRGHIHHRLLDLGLSHRATVLLIYAVCVVLAVLSLGLSGRGATYAFLGLVVVSGLALLFIERLSGGGREVEAGLSASSYPDDESADGADPGGNGIHAQAAEAVEIGVQKDESWPGEPPRRPSSDPSESADGTGSAANAGTAEASLP